MMFRRLLLVALVGCGLGVMGGLLVLPDDAPPATAVTPVPSITPVTPLTFPAADLGADLPPTSTPMPPATAVTNPQPFWTSEGAATELPAATPTFAAFGISQTIGTSAGGLPLVAYRFGYGARTLVFVGGMHGGYEWNTIGLAYEAIDYYQANPEQVPAHITLYIIPAANPDGQRLVTGTSGRFDTGAVYSYTVPGRFNANGVDLNRNWDCEWTASALWNRREVSGGEGPFSEPETQALAQFLRRQRPWLVVFWHSKADGVFASGCPQTFAPAMAAASAYGEAAGYPVYESFTFYPVTGDASNWLAAQGIPAITVELKTHNNLDWPQNLAGMQAVLALAAP